MNILNFKQSFFHFGCSAWCSCFISDSASLLNDFIFAIKALASGSVSKCFLTGSISSLITFATAGFKSFGCNFPSL